MGIGKKGRKGRRFGDGGARAKLGREADGWGGPRRTRLGAGRKGRGRIGGGRTMARRLSAEGKTSRLGDGAPRAKLVGSAWDRARDRGTFSRGGWSMREGERSDRIAARRGSFADGVGKMV